MQPAEIYHETIPFTVGRLIMWAMIGLTALFLYLFIYQITTGSIGDNPAPDWAYLVMMAVFAGVTILIANFTRLKISMTPDAVTVAFKRIKYKIPWHNVEGFYLDTNPGFAYGGWGIRLGKARGKSVLVYNIIGPPRVILELKEGRFKQFAFSTRRPEEVMTILKKQLR